MQLFTNAASEHFIALRTPSSSVHLSLWFWLHFSESLIVMYLWFSLESCQSAEEQLGKCRVDWPKLLKTLVLHEDIKVHRSLCSHFLSYLWLSHLLFGYFLDFQRWSYFTLFKTAGNDHSCSSTVSICQYIFCTRTMVAGAQLLDLSSENVWKLCPKAAVWWWSNHADPE